MRDSYKEWFKIFESHKLSLQNYKEEMAVLDEIYARRNILVHNSGRVNNSYLAMVKDSDKKLGDVLYVDEAYLNTAFDAINVLMFAIIIESVKLVSTDKKEYLQDVFSQTFEHLCEGRYYLCSRVYKALMESKYLDANHKTMSTVNYWISKIEMDGIDSVRPEIECFDVSALNTLFALAKDVLLEKYDAAKSLTSYLYKTGEITANMLETWPLFMHFRATTQYTEFKNEHAEDFKVATFEVNIENGRENEEVSIISEGVDAGNCMPEGINEIAAEKEAVVL